MPAQFALSGGVLSFRSSPDFEAPSDADSDNVYNVAVRASKGSLEDNRAVTIKVTNKEEAGVVSLSSRQPNVGIELVATLDDPDGGITDERWQWARSPDGSTRWSDIPAASSQNYTPTLADVDHYLRITVTYIDAQGPGKAATQLSDGATQVDNDGVVELSSSAPHVGEELTASLSDPDGGVSGETWRWARSPTGAAPWAEIANATSNAYTPVAGDVRNYLRATVSYTDADGPGKSAKVVSEDVVEPMTIRPRFPSTESGDRSVAENTSAGENVGTPVVATIPEGRTLTYTLAGVDANSFEISTLTGQLITKAALDFEARNTYTVRVTATDSTLASDTIAVTITVTDVTLGMPGDSYDANHDEAIQKSEVVSAIRDYFDNHITKSEVIAIVRLYFSG